MENRKVERIGIVLSGGFARGASQLAFTKEIINKIGIDRVKVLSGSSIGSLNCYAVSCGTIDEMLKYYESLDFDTIQYFKKLVRNRLFFNIFKQIEGKKMMVPTYVTGCRMFPFDTYYFCLNEMTRNDIRRAIDVSMSFPIINGPKVFKGKLFIDGGATNNVPTYPMEYFDLDMIIIIHCYPKYFPPQELFDGKKIIVDADSTLYLDKYVTSFSFSKTDFQDMIKVGERSGKQFADFIFQDFDYDNVQKRVHEYITNHLELRSKKSGDGLMTFVDFTNSLYKLKDES